MQFRQTTVLAMAAALTVTAAAQAAARPPRRWSPCVLKSTRRSRSGRPVAAHGEGTHDDRRVHLGCRDHGRPVLAAGLPGQSPGAARRLKDPATRRFAELNYGPWDRLAGNGPFVAGVGPKPPGAGFYPLDMTKEEFERANLPNSRSEYTVLTRNAKGALEVVPYSKHYGAQLDRAASLLERSAGLAEDPGLRKYLELRAKALRTDDYRASDMAWLDMKDNRLDLVIGRSRPTRTTCSATRPPSRPTC